MGLPGDSVIKTLHSLVGERRSHIPHGMPKKKKKEKKENYCLAALLRQYVQTEYGIVFKSVGSDQRA